MPKPPKDKNQDEADRRRDELAKRVLSLPPKPKSVKADGGKRSPKEPLNGGQG